MKWPFLNSQLSPFPSRSNRLESVDLWRIFYLWLLSNFFFDLIRVYRIEKLKSKCFVWLKPTSFVVLPQWESTFGITELVNPSRSFLKKNWEDHKKNQNPNRAVCFKTSIKLSSGLHLNISLFQVSRFKNFISTNFKLRKGLRQVTLHPKVNQGRSRNPVSVLKVPKWPFHRWIRLFK